MNTKIQNQNPPPPKSPARQSQNRTELRTTDYGLRTTRGFTLIESLVGISVLLLALAGPLTVAARGLVSANVARDQITAYFLAQEAIELVRNKRDENSLAGNDWLSGMDSCFTGFCEVAATSGNITFQDCSLGRCNPLKKTSQGIYGFHPAGTDTSFVRSIKIEKLPSGAPDPAEIRVTTTVSWNTGPISREVSLQTSFLRWVF